MGTGASTSFGTNTYDLAHTLKRSEADIVQLMMPVYYTNELVSEQDQIRTNTVWTMITNDTSPKYLEIKAKGTDYVSCIMFFYDTFYNRLFDVHPLCRAMFKSGMKTQGKFLVKMISLILSDINDSDKFNIAMVKLAEVHNNRGVKSIEYGIVGEVLFWTLREVLGSITFDKETHLAWIRVFSRILSIVVPVAVAFEIKTGSHAQKDRVVAENILHRNSMKIGLATTAPSRSDSIMKDVNDNE